MDNDTGDITGIGPGLTLEIKDRVNASPGAWIDQLGEEMNHASSDIGAVIWKRAGTTNVDEWFALMPVDRFLHLLHEAGYGDPTAHPKDAS